MNKITLIALAGIVSATSFSCKSKKLLVNDGAEVTVDKTVDDGLAEAKHDFSNVSRTDKGIVVTFDSDVLFPLNSSYLTDNAKTEIAKLVKLLKQHPGAAIQVDGHTDATGEAEYNLWLSDKRANSVKAYAMQLGMNGDLISTKGYGMEKPVASNKTKEGRQKNRRVEITILNEK
ncbi:Outer membrane protein OmpA [bacterium A37T11]|nr:Outer membrane protein OmpA [bacterium A37T11]